MNPSSIQTPARTSIVALLLTMMCAAAITAQKPAQTKAGLPSSLTSLVDSERDFARTAGEKGMRTAFLAFIADDCVLFHPNPVNGKEWWTARPDNPGLLWWEPAYADISVAGDLGYTTGPFEFRQSPADDNPSSFGQYMTIWRKQADDSWKFVLDQGTSTPAPSGKTAAVSYPADLEKSRNPERVLPRAQETLLAQELAFSKTVSTGSAAALLANAAEDIRFMRARAFPVIGKEAMRKALEASPVVLACKPAFAATARSGELGYTYGAYELKPAGRGDAAAVLETGHFVRIWKRRSGAAWKIVLDLLAPN